MTLSPKSDVRPGPFLRVLVSNRYQVYAVGGADAVIQSRIPCPAAGKKDYREKELPGKKRSQPPPASDGAAAWARL